jgi:2-oxoglutarate ferredoxin oxidoreductase subunit delta
MCKECLLCIHFCPNGHIVTTHEYNSLSYHPVGTSKEADCSGCALCATMCPEVAIEVYRE